MISESSETVSCLPDSVFVVFSAGSSENRIFEVFGRDQKDVRQKNMQIRGGIKSGTALFELFTSFLDFEFSFIFLL